METENPAPTDCDLSALYRMLLLRSTYITLRWFSTAKQTVTWEVTQFIKSCVVNKPKLCTLWVYARHTSKFGVIYLKYLRYSRPAGHSSW